MFFRTFPLVWIAAWIAMIASPLLAVAKTSDEPRPWELDPYRIMVYVAVADDSHLDQQYTGRLFSRLENRTWEIAGSAWKCSIQTVPDSLRELVIGRLPEIPLAEIERRHELLLEQYDKILLVRIGQNRKWEVSLRELDCRTRMWGQVHSSSFGQVELLDNELIRLMFDRVAPITMIGNVDRDDVVLEPKADMLLEEERLKRIEIQDRAVSLTNLAGAELTADEQFDAAWLNVASPRMPCQSEAGDAFFPIIRRNDRKGQLMAGGIMPLEWTYVSVVDKDWRGLVGKLSSGFGNPLGGRKSIRMQRYAIGTRPQKPLTRLIIADKSPSARPLEGYEVYSKDSGQDGDTVFVGTTDHRGMVEVGPAESGKLRILYVRSGGNLLARLPMVPGMYEELSARVPDDTRRLEAEGFVIGWRDKLIDTIAMRQVLGVRVRKELKDGDLEAADRWLSQLKTGTTVGELAFQFREAKGYFLRDRDIDPRIKVRIDELFEQGQTLVTQDRSAQQEAELVKVMQKAATEVDQKADQFGSGE